jgi:hypothetical protein
VSPARSGLAFGIDTRPATWQLYPDPIVVVVIAPVECGDVGVIAPVVDGDIDIEPMSRLWCSACHHVHTSV